MRNTRQRLIRALLAGLLPLALASCIDDGFKDSTPKRDAGITFSIMLPGSSTPSSPAGTRALTDVQENDVQAIDVLMFEYDNGSGNGLFVDVARASGTAISSDDTNGVTSRQKTFSVTMRQGIYDLVFLANARSFIDKQALTGMNKKEALASLETSPDWSGQWPADNSRPIPMWGYKDGVTISDNTDLTGANAVSMTRMVSRIDVVVNTTKVTNFQLTSVRVYNYNTLGSLVPYNYWDTNYWNPTDPDGARVVVPSVPASSALTEGPLLYILSAADQAINQYTREIYLYESENHNGAPHTNANKKDLLQRTCLVIGGKYGADPAETFYRVDFSTGNGPSQSYQDVLRNFWYTFQIDKVSDSGYADPDDAYRSEPVNIEANVLTWNDGSMAEVVSDGNYLLAVSPGEFTFYKDAVTANQGDNVMSIYTTYNGGNTPGWQIGKIVDAADDTTPATWLTPSATSGVYGVKTTIWLGVTDNDTGAERKAYVYVLAGKMRYKVLVTQSIAPTKQPIFTVISLNPAAGAVSITGTTTVTAKVHTNMSWTLQSSLGQSFTMNEPEGTAAEDYTMSVTIPPLTDLWGPSRSIDVTIFNYQGLQALTQTYTQTSYNITATGVPSTLNKYGQDVTINLTGSFPAMNFRAVDGADNLVSTMATCTATNGTSTVTLTIYPNYSGADRNVRFQYEKSSGVWVDIATASQVKSDLTLPTAGVLAPPGVLGVGATTGRLTLDGSKEYQAQRNSPAGAAGETVYLVYFKWGSTVAMSAGTGLNADTYDKTDVCWVPPGFSGTITNTYTSFTEWRGASFPAQDNVSGYGDPCKLAAANGTTGNYRMPTGTTYEKYTDGGWVTIYSAAVPTPGRWSNYGSTGSQFYPAAGFRGDSPGSLSSVGTIGYYWSATPNGTANAYNLAFTSGGANVSTSYPRGLGVPIRCIAQ